MPAAGTRNRPFGKLDKSKWPKLTVRLEPKVFEELQVLAIREGMTAEEMVYLWASRETGHEDLMLQAPDSVAN